MNAPLLSPGVYPTQWLRPTVEFLLATQRASGEIPWFDGGHTDPWDHTEAAMGLSIAGEIDAAECAYAWLAETQLEDGSWWACYREGRLTSALTDARPIMSPTLRPGSGTTF